MSWSTNIYQKIVHTSPGLLINRIKFDERRVVLFPRDIIGEYVRSCMHEGIEDSLFSLAFDWSLLFCHARSPKVIRKLPPPFVLNQFLRPMWKKIGGLEDIRLVKKGSETFLVLKHEVVSDQIGDNPFTRGSLSGILSFLYGKRTILSKCVREKSVLTYSILFEEGEIILPPSSKIPLFSFKKKPVRQVDLTEALRNGILSAGKGNTIFFRKTLLIMMENTFFHMVIEQEVGIELISDAARLYFEKIIKPGTSEEELVSLLKTLFQVFGWGVPLFSIEENTIKLQLQNTPVPLSPIKPNGLFFLKSIEGGLRSVNPSISLTDWSLSNQSLAATFTR